MPKQANLRNLVEAYIVTHYWVTDRDKVKASALEELALARGPVLVYRLAVEYLEDDARLVMADDGNPTAMVAFCMVPGLTASQFTEWWDGNEYSIHIGGN